MACNAGGPRSYRLFPQRYRQAEGQQHYRDGITAKHTQKINNRLRQREHQPPDGQIIGNKTAKHPRGCHDAKSTVVGDIDQKGHHNTAYHAEQNVLTKNHGGTQPTPPGGVRSRAGRRGTSE